jgi:hypothetical protein
MIMTAKIPSQASTLPGQAGADALRKDKSDKLDKSSSQQTKKLDASYDLELSETAQSMRSAQLPTVKNPAEAQTQLGLIRAAAERSAGSALSAHKPSAKAVVDLLA